MTHPRPIALLVLSLATLLPAASAHAQDARAAELIALNRALLEQQIVARDAGLFEHVAMDQFVVVAPGGVVEDKAQSAAGVAAFDAVGITVSEERVTFAGETAVLVGKLVIDGVMRPVGRLGPMRFMAVFVQETEGWGLLARSLTPCVAMAVERGLC